MQITASTNFHFLESKRIFIHYRLSFLGVVFLLLFLNVRQISVKIRNNKIHVIYVI